MKGYRTKKYNPECHVSIQITGSKEFFEDAKQYVRKKARKHKKQTDQDMSYEIKKVD